MTFTRRIDRRGYHPRLRKHEVSIKGFESLCSIFGGEPPVFARSQSHDLRNTIIRPEIDNISFTSHKARNGIPILTLVTSDRTSKDFEGFNQKEADS